MIAALDPPKYDNINNINNENDINNVNDVKNSGDWWFVIASQPVMLCHHDHDKCNDAMYVRMYV